MSEQQQVWVVVGETEQYGGPVPVAAYTSETAANLHRDGLGDPVARVTPLALTETVPDLVTVHTLRVEAGRAQNDPWESSDEHMYPADEWSPDRYDITVRGIDATTVRAAAAAAVRECGPTP